MKFKYLTSITIITLLTSATFNYVKADIANPQPNEKLAPVLSPEVVEDNTIKFLTAFQEIIKACKIDVPDDKIKAIADIINHHLDNIKNNPEKIKQVQENLEHVKEEINKNVQLACKPLKPAETAELIDKIIEVEALKNQKRNN